MKVLDTKSTEFIYDAMLAWERDEDRDKESGHYATINGDWGVQEEHDYMTRKAR